MLLGLFLSPFDGVFFRCRERAGEGAELFGKRERGCEEGQQASGHRIRKEESSKRQQTTVRCPISISTESSPKLMLSHLLLRAGKEGGDGNEGLKAEEGAVDAAAAKERRAALAELGKQKASLE